MKNLFLSALFIGSVVNATAQWNQCQTLTGGSIATDIISFNGKMYVAFNNGGVFRSANEGDAWEHLNLPSQGNFVHFVQHNSELLAVSNQTLFRTSDGDLWTAEDAPPAFINDLSSDGTTIFAATTSGIFQSTNAGADWSIIPDADTQVSIASVAVNGSKVWASADSPGIMFRSDNGGTSWTKIVKGTFKLTDLYVQGTDVYALAPYDAVYKSPDNGVTWQNLRSSLNGGIFFGAPGGLYHFTDFKLAVSTNSGVSWTVSTHTTPNFGIQSIYPGSTHFFVGMWGGGIYRNDLTGSGDWHAANSGLTVTEINDILIKGNSIFVGTDFAFIRASHDEAVTWDQEMDGYLTPGSARCITATGSDIYVGEGGAGVQRSANNGSSWEVKSNGLTSKIILGLAANASGVFAGTADGIFRSTDRAENWVKKSDGIPNSIRTLYSDDHGVYAGTFNGLFRSENDGESWTRISTGLPDESVGYIARIGSTLFAATQFHGLYKTTDFGAQWAPVLNVFVLSLAVRNDYIFIGSFNGKVFASPDRGTTWSEITFGLPDATITAIDFTTEHILAATYAGYGLWLRPLTEVMPPLFTFYSNHAGMVFRVGEPIFAKSDQELRTMAGAVLQSADLINYITIKDSHDQAVTYAAEIGNDKKTITITIVNATVGENYSVTLSPLKNASGLSSPETESDPFEAVNNLPPVVGNFFVSGPENVSITFSAANFTVAFGDEDSEPLVKIKVKTLPQHGTLSLNSTPVTANAEILAASLAQLTYSPQADYSGPDQWTWNGSDGKDYAVLDATVNITITPVTGIGMTAPENIQIYPNPVSEILHVEFPSYGKGTSNICLYDVTGGQIKRTHSDNDSMRSSDVDLPGLSSGIYFLRIEHSGSYSYYRVIKR